MKNEVVFADSGRHLLADGMADLPFFLELFFFVPAVMGGLSAIGWLIVS